MRGFVEQTYLKISSFLKSPLQSELFNWSSVYIFHTGNFFQKIYIGSKTVPAGKFISKFTLSVEGS
jgi:hypothetical protein